MFNLLRQTVRLSTRGQIATHNAAQVHTMADCVVDLRSDTVTKPSPAMRAAMSSAEVGDDVMREDPTVNALQSRCAAMFGKEAAMLVPSGTMGNLTAAMTHCQGRFSEVILGDLSHMFLHETGGIAQLASLQCNTCPNQSDGTILLGDIRSRIRSRLDVHYPWTQLICLENTQGNCGGKVLPLRYLAQVRQLADDHGLKLHLDGARIFNAATTLAVPVADIAQYFDSVSFCFSKGLACPIGSMLVGSTKFIDLALRARKALGGGMRQAGILAAAMQLSLDTVLPRLKDDHIRAKKIAQGIMSTSGNSVVNVDINGVHSNIVKVDMLTPRVSPAMLCQRMQEVTDAERSHLGESTTAKMFPFGTTMVRFVTHVDITDEHVEKVIKKFQYVINEFSK